jgi:hypothetical protein
MTVQTQEKDVRFAEEPEEPAFCRASLLYRLLTWRRVRRLERLHWESDQRFAWYVQDILVGCGLTQQDSSIAGGRTVHIPHVVAVIPGPPVSLDVHILPGQLPEDFAAHAQAIAYDLDVAEVRVIPLGPSMIRLELLP